ncbi:phosphatase 2C-like domain-containing protein [Dunaliella salina]|uniref:protein-serine/threonine phosphatase n=1 Tax=Dunaliella salina TaxID=3046 RepID=A0ABQ7H7K8_DUNSA|nr:phosphatase 2C-like domain-containing protein [Dunaliella salina]|eukprot:KAF5842845.1 phosphatase 2C-like domain-containing protein [Dunaliella salina]
MEISEEGLDGISFFAVFDGHGGRNVADFACERLHKNALEKLQQVLHEYVSSAAEASKKINVKAAKTTIIEAFKKTDEEVLAKANSLNWNDGACAAALWLVGRTGLVANCGDAKCVLARIADKDRPGGIKAGALRALVLTKDHLAIYPSERARIEKAGGSISEGRLQGKMQVARSFGDKAMKGFGCTSAPDVTAFELGPRDAFLILACDGFWGVFDAQNAVDMAQQLLAQGRGEKSVANRLLNEAVRERKCKDNVTVMLVRLRAGESHSK